MNPRYRKNTNVIKPSKFPFGTKEEIEKRMLTDMFRQVTPKEHCYFCSLGIPEENHLHASFLNLIPRCEPIVMRNGKATYDLNEKFLDGYRLVLIVDTTRAEEKDRELLVISESSGYSIGLLTCSRNFVEFVKMPIIPEEFVGKTTDFEFQVAVKVNNEDPCILNLSGNENYISVPSDAVLVTAHWKKIPLLALF